MADDHPVFRDGLRALLYSLPETELVGEAKDGQEAVAEAARLQPDVILMDIKMPGLNGIEATRQITAENPQTGILIFTMFEEEETVFSAMRAGARGYLLKEADQEEVVRAIQAVARGEAIFSPLVARKLINYFASPRPKSVSELFPDLTEREGAVLDLLARGYPNPRVAEQLGMSNKTVRNHVSNIFNKLKVADRTEAIMRAREAGLGQ